MYSTFKYKKDRIAYLREMLSKDPSWAVRGLLAVYKMQTDEEQGNGDVMEHNGVGFTGIDGEILSSFSEHVLGGRTLSQKQMDILYKLMPKYSKQLDGIAQDKLNQPQEENS